MVKIMLDAGHGPNTSGKRSPDGLLKEFMFNSEVAEMVRRLLSEEGMQVFLSHEPDKDVPLAERASRANRMDVDVFVSIHANAYGTNWNDVTGIETYIYPTAGKETQALASLIQNALILASNRKNRGVKKADFYVLRQTTMPAILIECGFMTNRSEMALLMKKTYRTQCAKAIAFAISGWVYRNKS